MVVLGIIFVLMMTGCGNSNSAEDSARILQEYLISVNKWESDYVLEPLDLVFGEIENEEIFCFEIRYMDDTEEVGGRLIDNYAITTDGQKSSGIILQMTSGCNKMDR